METQTVEKPTADSRLSDSPTNASSANETRSGKAQSTVSPGSDLPKSKARTWAWIIAATFPVWAIPAWLYGWSLTSAGTTAITTASGCLLLAMVATAAYTDTRWSRIPNWVTYTGFLWAIALNIFHSIKAYELGESAFLLEPLALGTVGIAGSVVGFLVLFCGLLFVFSVSGGGSGDVKLVGAIGAFLGMMRGAEAVFASFVICALVVLCYQVLKLGPAKIFGPVARKIGNLFVPLMVHDADEKSKEVFKKKIPLGAYFAVGTLLVLLRDSGLFDLQLFG